MDALQAIALSGKLARNPAWNERRQILASRYREQLIGTSVRLVDTDPRAEHVYHLLVARVADRDRVQAELRDHGVQTGVHYPVPCHRQPPLREFATAPMPVTDQAAAEIISLPMFPHMTADQVDVVCDALAEITATRTDREVRYVA